jgi:hypothetical protein
VSTPTTGSCCRASFADPQPRVVPSSEARLRPVGNACVFAMAAPNEVDGRPKVAGVRSGLDLGPEDALKNWRNRSGRASPV